MKSAHQDRNRWRWPRSARHARVHATLLAIVLWTALCVILVAGHGNRSIAGPIKGPDYLQFYTSGWLVRTHQADTLYDIRALHAAQVALVPESEPELYPPVYPPQMGLLFASLSALPYRASLLAWIAFTVLMYALIVRSAWRPLAGALPDRRFVFVAAAAFPPFWSLVLFGQLTIVILLAFWGGWMALERKRPFLAGCAFGVLALKPQFGLTLAVVTIAGGEWSMLAGAVVSVVLQTAAVIAVLGRAVLYAYVSSVPTLLRYADLLESKPFQSHSLRAITRLLPGWLGPALWVIVSAVLIAFVVRIWKRDVSWRVRMSVLMFVSVVVNPHLIIYDAVLLALPLMWLGGHLIETGQVQLARTYWTLVYWLCVALLAPTAAAVKVQASVLLMLALLYLVREGLHKAPSPASLRALDVLRDRAIPQNPATAV